ncbi:MAG: hypothetical protein KF691_03475 [Phycisphaeraceae bacterium]|nr:hypothetical protein [Phycisphaeraceae bacterium]
MASLLWTAGIAVISHADDIPPCQPDADTAKSDKGPAGETSSCSYSPITDKPQPRDSGVPKNLNCPGGCDKPGSGYDAGDGVYITPPQDFDLPSPFQPAVFCGIQVRGDAFCSISYLRPSIGVPWPGLGECDLVEGIGNLGNGGTDGLRPELQRFSADEYRKDYITMSTPQGGYKTFRRYPAVASGITGGRYKDSPTDTVHSILFVGVNGESGVLLAKPRVTSPDEIPPLVEYYGTDGTKMTFFGFYDDTDEPDPFVTLTYKNRLATGQLWKLERPKGTSGSNVLYVGDPDDPLEAANEGFDAIITGLGGSGYYGAAQVVTRVNSVIQQGGNKYVYEYGTRPPYRLAKITIQTQDEEPIIVRTIDYNYYDDLITQWPPLHETFPDFPDGCGGHGDLRLVTVTTPTNSGDLVEHTYYRYYTGSEPTTGAIPPYPLDATSPCHQLKAIVGPEGMRRLLLEQEHGLTELEDIHDDELINYASTWLQYGVTAWIDLSTSEVLYEAPEGVDYDQKNGTRVLQQSGCGCGGEASRAWQFFYESGSADQLNDGEPVFNANGFVWTRLGSETAPSAKDAYDTKKSYEIRADGTFRTRLFDGYQQQVGEYVSDTYATYETDWSSAKWQATVTDRDVRDRVQAIFSPSAIDPETFNPEGGDIRVLPEAGLVQQVGYMTAYPTGTSSGDIAERATKAATDLLAGTPTQRSTSIGATGTAVVQDDATFKSGSAWSVNVLLPPDGADWSGDHVRAPFSLPLETKAYTTESTSGASEDTTYSYTTWSAGTDPGYLIMSIATSRTVSSSENGSGSAVVSTEYRYRDGRTAFRRSEDGRWTYFEYNYAGQLTRSIQDVKSGSSDIPTGVTTAFGITPDFPSSGQHLVHEYEYDGVGRLTKHQLPPTASVSDRSERFYYFTAPDGRKITMTVPMVIDTGSEERFFGPVSYRVENLAGKVEVDAELAIAGDSDGGGGYFSYSTTAPTSWIDVEAENVLTAIQSPAAISRLRVNIYNRSGVQLQQSRVYHTILTGTSTDAVTDWGSGGTGSWVYLTAANAEVSKYEYDAVGRAGRVTDPTGTITRTVYDYRGLAVERWIGTDDIDETIGTGRTSPSSGGNMTKVATFEYIPGEGASDGWLSKTTQDADGNWGDDSDQRITEYLRDYRGRVIVEKRTDAPTLVRKYDNLGRVIAQATYKSTASVTAATDPTSTGTDRLSLSETLYDGRGQVWKTVMHRINQSSGAIETDSSNALMSLFRYDPVGRLIKTTGTSLSKMRYDGLGRVLRRWTLAADGTGISDGHMSSYTNDYSATVGTLVNGNGGAADVVLELQQSVYEPATGNLLGRVQISRSQAEHLNWTSSTLGTMGDLHGNDDVFPTSIAAADVKGRMQLTTYFYDDLNRVTFAGFWGHGGAGGFTDYDPLTPTACSGTAASIPGSIPSSSTADVLVMENRYNAAGDLEIAIDADGKKTKTEYTDDGRVEKVTRNYVNGTAGGGTYDDDDQIVEYAYTNGLLTSMTAVIPASQISGSGPTAAGPQVTEYHYGTTKGTLGDSSSGASAYASSIATGKLLNRTVYPDGTTSSGSTATVHVAYNALGEAAWSKDQLDNVIFTDRDNTGRVIATRVASFGSTYDPTGSPTAAPSGAMTASDVVKIGLEYDERGLVEKVTQYDDSDDPTDQVKYAYDDYGMLTEIRQQTDGAIASPTPDGYAVSYTNSRAAPSSSGFVGRQSVRRTAMTLPGATTGSPTPHNASAVVAYRYFTSSSTPNEFQGNLNDLAGRVEEVYLMGDGEIAAASYSYLGAAQLVGTMLEEPGYTSRLFADGPLATNTSAITGVGLDRFNRVKESRWGRESTDGSSPIEWYAYRTNVNYSSGGDITSTQDRVTPGTDVLYVNDGLHRLVAAQEGTLASGSISSQTFKQTWSLSHTGNWLEFKDFADAVNPTTATREETRTNTAVNEIATRTVDTGTPVTTPFVYNKAGQLTDDGERVYTYDAFGRLRYVHTRGTSGARGTLIEESRYNGLGHRIAYKLDTDLDGDLDGVGSTDNVWVDQVYDDSWRIVATFKHGDDPDKPHERFVYHNAGMDGRGSSSYIDDVILRERDNGDLLSDAAGASLADRLYYLQNWRHDVVAISKENGEIVERPKYTSYGVPKTASVGDFNHDGLVEDADFAIFSTSYNELVVGYTAGGSKSGEAWAVCDLNQDGIVDDTDYAIWVPHYTNLLGVETGQLSNRSSTASDNVDSRIGYGGYIWNGETAQFFVRNRICDFERGTWISRDYIEYLDGSNLFQYVGSIPIRFVDPSGLCKVEVRYADIGNGLLHYYHAYVVTTSADGSQTYFRGGPTSSPSSGPSRSTTSGPGGASTPGDSRSGSSPEANGTSPGVSDGGGPANGNGYGPWGPIDTSSGPFAPGTIDWDGNNPNVPKLVLQDDAASCDEINKRLLDALNKIQNCKIPYNPIGDNSNSVAHSILEKSGFPRPISPVWAPGSDNNLLPTTIPHRPPPTPAPPSIR